MIDISIIIVNWNTQDLLVKTLRSIDEQKGAIPVEIIVVDNGSTDGSVAAVAREFPHVRLIVNSENLGFAKANNIGIKESSGRYVSLINSDILLTDKTLHTLMHIMDNDPAIGIAGPQILNPNRTLRQSCRRYPSVASVAAQAVWLDKLFPRLRTHMTLPEHASTREVDVLAGCFWFVRREALEEVGLLDEMFFIYSEDVDWCKRFSEKGWGVVYLHEARSIHIGKGSSSLAPTKFFIEMQKSFMQYWRKHHGIYSAMMMHILLVFKYSIRIVTWSGVYLAVPPKKEKAGFMIDRYVKTLRWMLSPKSHAMSRQRSAQ